MGKVNSLTKGIRMSKLITVEAFNAEIKTLARVMKSANAKVQSLAITAVGYSILHGDVRPATTLVEELPKGLRKDALVKWLEVNGCLAWSKEGKKFLHYKSGVVFDEKKLAAALWYDAKKEKEPESVYDVAEMFDKFMDRVNKLAKDGNLEVKNKTLLTELAQASGKWHQMMSAEVEGEKSE